MVERAASFGRTRFPWLTPRLAIRPPRRNDAPALVELLQERSVHRWLLRMPYPYHMQDAIEFLRRAPAQKRSGEGLRLLVTLRDSGTVIGCLGASSVDWTHRHAMVGYWFGRPYWGEGYATEAVEAACAHFFQDLQFHRLSAYVFHPNAASQHVLEKAGFQREGRGREAYLKQGRWVDDIAFGLLAREWRERRRARR